MASHDELKVAIQAGWNIPTRISNYVQNVAHGEFDDEDSSRAWRTCLGSALPPGAPLKILDVGTGPGVFACLYAQMGHPCVGLDFSQSMLNEARQRATQLNLDCNFVFADAEEPPFQSETFDVVSSRHLLFNLPRPGHAVRQWVRLLKPGGTMILIGHDPLENPPLPPFQSSRQDEDRRQHRRSKDGQPGWQPSPEYINAAQQCPLFKHNAGVIRALMEAAGLENVHSHPSDELIAARRHRDSSLHRPEGPARSHYVLVGTKPCPGDARE
jgi:SAM-dependent methyltransferase